MRELTLFSLLPDLSTNGDELTLNDVNSDRVRLGLGGGAGVIAGVGLGDLGHEEPGGPPPALGHHADPAPERQNSKMYQDNPIEKHK